MKKAEYMATQIKLLRLKYLCICCFFLVSLHYKAQNAIAVPGGKMDGKMLSGIYSSEHPKSESSFDNYSYTDDFLPVTFLQNYPGYTESVDKRTYTTRTYEDGKGGIIVQNCLQAVNYLDEKQRFMPVCSKLEAAPEKEGWIAPHQQYPTYLFKTGITAISTDKKNQITFNKNCKINGNEICLVDYTVGRDGMCINNAIPGVNKKIFFEENAIETDYTLQYPVNTNNQDLIISEEIELPEGYSITPVYITIEGEQTKTNTFNELIIYSANHEEKARFRAPLFYDAKNEHIFGTYNLIHENNKNIVQLVVPYVWLNHLNRAYPVIIDPLVTGPTANYPPVYMNSCLMPSYASDSILVTIPAGITITSFIVEDSYFADAIMGALMKHGHMNLSTTCGSVTFSCQGTAADSSGTCYLVPNTDLKSDLACCFTPACTTTTFYLTHALGRDSYGPGCNQTYIYYSPVSLAPPYPNTLFSAFIVGRTVETTQAQWMLFPTTLCSDSCSLFLKATTKYGIPPYTITHPWATGSSQYGASTSGCNSIGNDTILLHIPNCPSTCGTNPTLSIPPPHIVDVCGDSVTGLTPKSITIKPVPVATATSVSVCSGNVVHIPLSSCVTGSTFQWAGNGSSGSGDISNPVVNNGVSSIVINYSVIPTANGCVGDTMHVSAEVNPKPIISAGLDDSIESGASVQLNATGGMTYLWTPPTWLTCTSCANPTAAPLITTSYYATGTNEFGCSSTDTMEILVAQNSEVLYIPNSFSPNENDVNDLFFVYGSMIKNIDVRIFDRWGQQVFHTSDLNQGWDGRFKGQKVEGGVYVYYVHCEWVSGEATDRTGIVTVLR